MLYAQKVKSFIYTGKTQREAYIKGCFSLMNIMTSKEFKNASLKIDKVENGEEQVKITFSIYTNLGLNQEQSHFCKTCKGINKSSFIEGKRSCSRCKLKRFLELAKEKAMVSKRYYKKEIEKKEIRSDESSNHK